MKKAVYGLLVVALVAGFALTHLACSSSSDDESTPAAVQRVTLDKATVDEAVAFMQNNVSFCTISGDAAAAPAVVRAAVGVAEEAVDRVALARADEVNRSSLADTAGSCGGTLSTTDSEDPVTGAISGSLTLTNFCQEVNDGTQTIQVTLNGSAQFSGTVDPGTGALKSLTASTGGSGITATTDQGDSFTVKLSGAQLAVTGNSYAASLLSLTVDTLIAGESTSVAVNNLTANVTNNSPAFSVTGSAEIVHSVEGSVGVTVDLDGNTDTGEATDGTVKMTGAGGTSVTMTIDDTSKNTFDVSADTDGDGADDYFPATVDCSTADVNNLLGP